MEHTRSDWARALTALERWRVRETVAELSKHWQLHPRQVPTAGLALLQLRDGAFGEGYFLGEATLSTADLLIELADGRTAQGAARILADDAELAQDVAVCDAVLAGQLPGWEQIAALVDEGLAVRHKENRVRRSILARTRVEFDVMTPQEGEDGED